MGLSPVFSNGQSSLQTRGIANRSTPLIGVGLSFSGTIQIGSAFILHSIFLSSFGRIRLYQTNSQLVDDASRLSSVAPTGSHGLIFEGIGSGKIITQFGVVGANKELVATNSIPFTIENLSAITTSFDIEFSFTKIENN